MTVTVAPPPATPATAGVGGTLAPTEDAVRGQLAPGVDMPFVWSAYAMSLIVLVALWWRSRRLLRGAGEIGARDRQAGRAEENRP